MEVLTKLPYMNGGDGQTSYSENSSMQRMVIALSKPIREQAIIDLLRTMDTKTLHIADLGCGSGPNAFLVIPDVLKMACNISQILERDIPEFQVFLNDLPDTDFNTIFHSLAGFQDNMEKELGLAFGACFVNGVPGSFYGRLFPSKSLHFVHSSYSLMWLSQVPDGLESNKGNIYRASTSPPQVLKAYYEQFERDFSLFLKSRSQELVPGGRMVLTFRGRESNDPASKESTYIWDLLAIGLKEMTSEGIIKQEKMNSFNIPEYTPCPSEVKHIVENDGSFTIESLTLTQVPWAGGASPEELIDPYSMGAYVAKYMRSVAEPMLVSHFGKCIIDEAFRRYTMNLCECYTREAPNFYNITISLTRK